ncbi:MAG: TRAP transporter permease, partial [Nitrospinota bacterium]
MATFAELQFLTTDGVMGVPLGVAAEIVFYFILFSALLEVSGGGQLFINLAMRATGSMRGGPAKAAVVSSGLMGTISGSATANVVGTGIFTIPLMKRLGFTPRFAGAVEAVASTGGQLMPPIMGAGAFIMADMTGIPYLRIAVAATLPAIIYYSSLFAMVDFQARRSNLRGLLKSQLPSAKRTLLERGLLIIGLVVLVYYIFAGFSLIWAAWWALVWTFFL